MTTPIPFDPIQAFLIAVRATALHLPSGVTTLTREDENHIGIAISVTYDNMTRALAILDHLFDAGYFPRKPRLTPTTKGCLLFTCEIHPRATPAGWPLGTPRSGTPQSERPD